MISSQRPWPLDHEAGLVPNMKVIKNVVVIYLQVLLRQAFKRDVENHITAMMPLG